MADVIKVEKRARGAVWITIDRPEAMNALSNDVLEGLELALERANEDPETRAVVITGAGDKAFCAGADLKERRGMSQEESRSRVFFIGRVFTAIAEFGRPTIAALNGVAFGGGLELALACDLRVAADDIQVGLPEVRLGILPGAGGTQRLPRLIGVARAKELILTGRRIDAKRAHEIGLVGQLAPRAELTGAVEKLLEELEGAAPLSIASAKEAVDRGFEASLDEGLMIERSCYERTLDSEDRLEGLAAFAEKRAPRYQGR